jgi:recombination protein RecA
MATAQQLRAQIESQLSDRIPSALTPIARLERPTISSGINEIDTLLGGGFPLGAISELSGPSGSGRTTLALSLAATVTLSGNVCAWIDVSNALDPASAAANHVELANMLWVRCGLKTNTPSQSENSTYPSAKHSSKDGAPSNYSNGGIHPRDEVRGMDKAVSHLLQTTHIPKKQTIGSPSAPNIPFGKVVRDEQITHDRMPSRRNCTKSDKSITTPPLQTCMPHNNLTKRNQSISSAHSNPWPAIHQAIRVIDLLLSAGGFQLIVLDLADVNPENVTRIPPSTWFRFRASSETRQCCFLLLTQHSSARSSATVSLQLKSVGFSCESTVLKQLNYQAELIRKRFESDINATQGKRKPPASSLSTVWASQTAWVR